MDKDFDLVLFQGMAEDYYEKALETKDDNEVKEFQEEEDLEGTPEYFKKDDNGDFIIYEVYGEGAAKDTKEQFKKVVDNMSNEYPSIAELRDKHEDDIKALIDALNENDDWLGEWGGNIIYGIYKEVK